MKFSSGVQFVLTLEQDYLPHYVSQRRPARWSRFVTLRAGCPLIVPETFNLPVDWIDRVSLGSGIERVGSSNLPLQQWRAPEAAELSLLLPDETAAKKDVISDSICLFSTSRHLTKAWSRVLEKSAVEADMPTGFDRFIIEIARFLAIKELPVPEGATYELLETPAGHRSFLHEEQSLGLTFNPIGPFTPKTTRAALWGGINLGDEVSSLIYINLTPDQMLAEVRKKETHQKGSADLIASRFLALHPEYAPIRLRIEPGEGFRLPTKGLLIDGCTLDKTKPDLLLLICCPE